MRGEDKEHLVAVNRVIDACAAIPLDDRLLVLEMAWIVLAQLARNEALSFPGGFQAKQCSQLGQLEKIACLVREDTPDIEHERLLPQGDFEGVVPHLRKLMDDLSKGGA